MKPLKIVFMLTLIVTVFSLAVYFVEGWASGEIEDREREEMRLILESLGTIFPEMDYDTDSVTSEGDQDFGITGITDVLVIKDGSGNPKGYIYFVEFNGFSSTIKYYIGIDAEGNITGYETLQQGDTPGYGAQIADPINWTQFAGMSIETAGNGNFDGLAGASITTGAWKTSLNQLYTFHLNTYGYTPLTDEQLLQIRKEAMVGGDSVSAYTETNAFTSYGITNIDIASDGTSNTAVIYTVEFVGYNPSDINEFMIAIDLATNNVIAFEALYSGDTPSLGAEIMNEDNWTQFDGMTQTELLAGDIDTLAGATVTTDAWKAALQQVTVYHQMEFLGIVVLTPEQQFEAYKQALFTDAVRFDDVTEFKPNSPIITTIYDAYDDTDTFLGTVYHITTIGASYSEFTYIEFLIGIDASKNFTGFQMVSDTETAGKTDDMYEDTYDDNLVGDAIDATIQLDAVAGSTITYNRIINAIEELAIYHVEKYEERPDSIAVDTADLLLAFPSATSFVSVYEDYEFDALIGNIYEAQDGSGSTLGYVYYGTADGNSSSTPIEFVWGVASDGTTQQLHIINHAETWAGATDPDYGTYDGSYGTNFGTSTWLDLFEGINISTVVSSPIDEVTGVSNTTGAMKLVLEGIAQYHSDQAVGGAS